MVDEQTVQQNIRAFFERLALQCARVGRRESDIAVVAATKCVPKERVHALPQWGIGTVGENRVQEFCSKYDPAVPLAWHIIGALQTNKVKYAVGKVAMIQSVDRLSLLQEIDRLSVRHGCVTDILVEVNIGGEQSKSGVAPYDADALCESAAGCKNVRLRGLMSVPPVGAPESMYRQMRDLFERLQKRFVGMDTLSMGMSNDFERAIACGATMVRPGRVLFGDRT